MAKRKTWAFALGAAAALALSACATATPYQPSAGGINSYGYSDTRLEPGKYRVGFRGNTSTDRATVENYILLRAAELTTNEGFGHFVLLGEGEGSTSSFNSTGFNTGFGGFGGFGVGRRGFGSGFGGTTSSRTRERRNFDINVVIQAFPGKKSAENYEAFNAEDIIANLR